MPYPYGMQNSPVVGNGLGGLPRRTTASAAVATTGARKYELQQIAQSNYSWGSTASVQTPVIMMRGKLVKYVLEGGTIKRWSCTYSDAGLGTASVQSLGTTTWTTGMLPQSGNYGKMNYCWSLPISTSQTLFFYTGVSPFLVTYDGDITTSYVTPSAPSTGTYSNYSGTWSSMTLNTQTAIIGKNGNLLMIGYDSGNNWYALLEFNSSDLSFVKAAWTGIQSIQGPTMYLPRIRTTSFGYVIAIQSNVTGASYTKYLFAATLSDNYVRISTRSVEAFEPNFTDTMNVISNWIGSQSIMTVFATTPATSNGNVQKLFAMMNYSSSGVLTGDVSSIPTSTVATIPVRNLVSFIPSGTGSTGSSVQNYVTTNIDGTAMTGFCDYQPGGNWWLYGPDYQTGVYYDFDIEIPPSTIRSAPRITTLCTKSFPINDMNASGVAQDSDGFVFIDNSKATQVNILYKKVYT